MTIKKIFLFLFLQLIILLAVKLVFFKVFNVTSDGAEYFYWVVLAIVGVALVRRLAVINYLEAAFVALLWFLFNVFFDLIVTARFLGIGMFGKWQLWVGYLVLILSIFFFHRKRHVEIRKEQAAHHHDHH
jgi:hypothetical protein